MKYVVGNLLDVTSGTIVHGCNAYGVMGSGVAAAVRQKYPDVYERYRDWCLRYENKEDLLGRVLVCRIDKELNVANLISQMAFGTDKRHTDYPAIERGLNSLTQCTLTTDKFHLPKIGAGLGGGDWNIIEGIIKDTLVKAGMDVTIWVLDDKEIPEHAR